MHTVYTVRLIMILIWRFGKFVFIHQINVCTVYTRLYPYVIWMALVTKLNTHQFTLTYQFAKLYVHQMYCIYSIVSMVFIS